MDEFCDAKACAGLNQGMRRYLFSIDQIHEDYVEIEGNNFHHICGVCRLDVGDQFEVLGIENTALKVEITQRDKKRAIAKIIDRRRVEALQKPRIHLAISMTKPQTFEFILEKSVELGVFSVRPFVSDRSFFRKVDQVSEAKYARWQKKIDSATQQSGRGEILELKKLVGFEEILKNFNHLNDAMGLFLFEGRCEMSLKEAVKARKTGAPDDLWLFIGSEGGFSQREVECFKDIGLEALTLGEQVLRVETACLAMISIIKYEYDLMS